MEDISGTLPPATCNLQLATCPLPPATCYSLPPPVCPAVVSLLPVSSSLAHDDEHRPSRPLLFGCGVGERRCGRC